MIYLDAPRCKLALGNLSVNASRNVNRHIAKLAGNALCRSDILGRKRLNSKAHIHNLGGVTVARCEVYEPALCDNENGVSVGELIAHNVVARGVAFG